MMLFAAQTVPVHHVFVTKNFNLWLYGLTTHPARSHGIVFVSHSGRLVLPPPRSITGIVFAYGGQFHFHLAKIPGR